MSAPAPILRRGLITASTMLAMVMQILDMTIANVALPNMQGTLNATQDTITWVLTSYIVAAAVMTPLTGWIATRIGRKRLFLISVTMFTVASLLCGLATSLEQMVLFRVLQGAAGAALAPLAQTVLFDITPRERFGQAMAIFGSGIMVAPIVGPAIGGWLTDSFGWRWCFLINLPVGVIAFLGLFAFLPETERKPRYFDLFGFALLTVSVGALQMLLDRGERLDWFAATETWIELGLAIGAFWMFAVHTVGARTPFIDRAIFRDRNFVSSSIFMFTLGLGLMANMALLPMLLQGLMRYPTLAAGVVLAPRGVGTLIAMALVGRLMRSVDARLLVLTGLLLTAWSLDQMTTFAVEMGEGPILISGFIQGAGMGMVFVPMSTLAFATLAGEHRTDATALFTLVRSIGSAIGISIVAAFLAHNFQVSTSDLTQHVNPFNPAIDPATLQGLVAGAGATVALMAGTVARQAQMIAFLDDFRLMEYLTLATIPLVFMLAKPAPSGSPAMPGARPDGAPAHVEA